MNNIIHHQPAVSAYAPISRNNLLYHPNRKPSKKSKVALVTIYLLLKYWDTPRLQAVFRHIARGWANNVLKGNPSLIRLFESNTGRWTGKTLSSLSLISAQCLIKTIHKLRFDKLRILQIPNGLQQWVNVNVTKKTKMKNSNWCQMDSLLQEVKTYSGQIDNILMSWFGQYNPDKAQKNLWMVAASSKDQLQKVDSDITEKYAALLRNISTNDRMREIWCSKNNNDDDDDDDSGGNHFFGWKGKLAAIILLDQMSRHIHRYCTSNNNDLNISDNGTKWKPLPPQANMDKLAFEISQQFQNDHMEEIQSGMIPTPMLIFALMPFRHASTLQTVGFVQKKIEEISCLNSTDMENMIRRFRRATNRRMAVLQDDARRAGRNTHYDDNNSSNESNAFVQNEETECTKASSGFIDEDILEFQPFTADMSSANQHALVKTMIDYLADRGVFRVKSKSKICKDTPILVSLSGGVDSMVICNVLAYLRDECGYSQLYLVAVHIDYGNRPESAAEAEFVRKYAIDHLKYESCIIRRIDEVTRGETKRDEYEKVSRNVRYVLYRETILQSIKICCNNNEDHEINEVGVMLGHHRGDLVENVISNSNKGSGPLDLSGMTSVSQNDGVTIYRPLLTLDKDDVYDYSHKYGVPYFKDTTPHWSTRGKLRNKLIPLLEEVYGDGCLSNLSKLAVESDEARVLFNEAAICPFMDTVKRYPMGVMFSTAPFKSQGSYFWKIVLRDLLHSVGLGIFSDKSITSFLERVLAKNIRQGWLQCRKDYAVYLMKDGRVMVLHPERFPFRKNEYYKLERKDIQFGEEIVIGPWSVTSEIVLSIESDQLIRKKAVENIEDLMLGEIEYYVKVLTMNNGELQPLIFIDKFTKESRPPSWKNADLKVELTLPIIGNDEPTAKLLSVQGDRNQERVARVTLKLN